MTDSTERSPTFSLPVFENFDHPDQVASAVYLHLRGSQTTSQAWLRLMRRPIRGLNWDATHLLTGNKVVLGYDFSDQVIQKRARSSGGSTKPQPRIRFELGRESQADHQGEHYLQMIAELENQLAPEVSVKIPYPAEWRLSPETQGDRVHSYRNEGSKAALVLLNILTKMLLNAHSTAAMGYLKRFEQNVMSYVAPSNFKLIDRSVRYIELLLRNALPDNHSLPDYETVVRKIYDIRNEASPGQPIVLLVRDFFLKQAASI